MARRPARLTLCLLFLLAGAAQTAIVPLLPRIAGHDHLPPLTAALALSLPGVAMLLVAVPAGALVDRIGARRVTLAAAALLTLACALQTGASLPALLGGRVALGLAYGTLWTAGAAWLAAGAEGGTGSAVLWASMGTMVGPALGGGLSHGADPALPFGLLTVVGAGLCLLLRAVPAPPVSPEAGGKSGEGVGPVAFLAGLRDPAVAAGAGALFVGGLTAGVAQLLVADGLRADHVAAAGIGWAFSACAALYVATSVGFVALGRRACTPLVGAIVSLLAALALVPALAGGGAGVLTGALLLTAAPRGAINVVGYGLVARRTAKARAGLAFGILNGAWGVATVVGPLAAGGAAQVAGPSAGFLLAVVPGVAVALWLLRDALRGTASRGGGGSARPGGRLVRVVRVPRA